MPRSSCGAIFAPMQRRGWERTVPWGVRDVALGILCAAVGVIAVVAVTYLLDVLGVDVGVSGMASTAILGCVLVGVSLYLGPGRHKASPETLGMRLIATRGHLLLAAAVLLGTLGLGELYALAVGALGWEHMMPPDLPGELGLKGVAYFFGVPVIVLWAPFSEELFFRAFLFAGLAGRMGTVGAMLASSVLFGVAHADFGAMTPAFLAGFLLVWLYWRTGSLWPCLLVHATQNAIALAVSGL